MNKKIQFILSFLMSFIMFINVGNSAFASEIENTEVNSVNPYYVNISSINSRIYKSGLIAHCVTIVKVKSKKNIFVRQYLQRKDGLDYVTLDHWDTSATNVDYLEVENTRGINLLKNYRLRSDVRVGTEEATVYRYLE